MQRVLRRLHLSPPLLVGSHNLRQVSIKASSATLCSQMMMMRGCGGVLKYISTSPSYPREGEGDEGAVVLDQL